MAFTIRTCESPPLLCITMRGFWTMPIFDRYMAECGAAIAGLMRDHGRFDTIGNCNDFPIQGPDVAAAFERLKALAAATPDNRIAIITASALGRMQALRLVGNAHSRIFATEAAARAWLGLA